MCNLLKRRREILAGKKHNRQPVAPRNFDISLNSLGFAGFFADCGASRNGLRCEVQEVMNRLSLTQQQPAAVEQRNFSKFSTRLYLGEDETPRNCLLTT